MITIHLAWYAFFGLVCVLLLLGAWVAAFVQALLALARIVRQRGSKHGH